MNATTRAPLEQVRKFLAPFSSPLPAADDGSDHLPLAFGVLGGDLIWRRDHDGDPETENAECRIRILCPFCGQQHEHGWRLNGVRRTERRRAHCGEGEYRVRPGAGSRQKWGPYDRFVRPARRGAAP